MTALPPDLMTPRLLLDVCQMEANTQRMTRHISRLGGRLRPHMKTLKSADAARRAFGEATPPITVSTLREAEYFADAGFGDILYAVGLAPAKLDHVLALRRRGVDLSVVIDNMEAAVAIADAATDPDAVLPVLIELNVDGHRAGVTPASAELVALAATLATSRHCALRGVMTHAGASYDCRTVQCLREAARQERLKSVESASVLREAGFASPVVSIGSTPTALFAESLDGVTEVRAGVFMPFDLVMAGLGVCDVGEIALSVLTTVIGRQADKGMIIIDAGWMALSRDRGTSGHAIDQGYGLVMTEDGQLIPDLVVTACNQEHGVITHRHGHAFDMAALAIGARLRILPVHACATASQHQSYLALGAEAKIIGEWPRISGWSVKALQ